MEQKNKFLGAYESPAMNVLNLNVEGVLCGSGRFDDMGEDAI